MQCTRLNTGYSQGRSSSHMRPAAAAAAAPSPLLLLLPLPPLLLQLEPPLLLLSAGKGKYRTIGLLSALEVYAGCTQLQCCA